MTTLAVFLALSAPIHTYPVPHVALSVQPIIDHWSMAYLVPLFLARKVAWAESDDNPRAQSFRVVLNTNPHVPNFDKLALYRKIIIARGLFQISVKDQYELMAKAGMTSFCWWKASDSARVGLAYLSRLHDRYGRWDWACAAFNEGPGAFESPGEVPKETFEYVKRIFR